MSIITGASTRIAIEKATPYAARLILGSGSRAMRAARSGPSSDIMIHVAARGDQKRVMYPAVGAGGRFIFECFLLGTNRDSYHNPAPNGREPRRHLLVKQFT